MNNYETIIRLCQILEQAKKEDKSLIKELITLIKDKELVRDESSRLDILTNQVADLQKKLGVITLKFGLQR